MNILYLSEIFTQSYFMWVKENRVIFINKLIPTANQIIIFFCWFQYQILTFYKILNIFSVNLYVFILFSLSSFTSAISDFHGCYDLCIQSVTDYTYSCEAIIISQWHAVICDRCFNVTWNRCELTGAWK